MKYVVSAKGHLTRPDIVNLACDELPPEIREYKMQSVLKFEPVRLQDIKAALR